MAKKNQQEETAPIIAYKGFDSDWTCRGYKYVVGESYEHKGKVKVKACEGGFHACEYPLHVLRYYRQGKFAIVEQSGQIARHDEDSKVASSRITIKAELSIADLIKAAVKYTLDRCTTAEGAASDKDNTVVMTQGQNKSATASGYSGAATASGYSGVFGSNLSGIHGGGAARAAHDHYGAEWGVSQGITGRSYAIPTVREQIAGPLTLDAIRMYVERFIFHAQTHPEDKFFVTRIGCGLAGHKDEDIAPIFKDAPLNCSLPQPWRRYIEGGRP